MTLAEAMAMLGAIEPLDEAQVRKRHREAAFAAHPDVGGSDAQMALANEARDLLLKLCGAPKVEPKCVCKGFVRNPLCKAHEDERPKEKDDELAAQCVCRGFARNPLCKAHEKKG